MLGCYLTSDDDKYLDVIIDELNKYNSLNDSTFILLFPSLSSRHRLLLHRLREKSYPNLFSFSVGENKNTRRTVICFKVQLMDETNRNVSPSTTIQSNDESSTKRRPDQALYKPPRRSKNPDVSNPVSTPSTTSVDVIQQNDNAKQNNNNKSTKTKTARPSAEPYIPPSRRNQPVNNDSFSTSTVSTSSSAEKKKDDNDDNNEDEEEWEKLLDDDGNLTNDYIDEIQTKFKENVQIKKPTNDYSQWSVDDIQIREADLAHIVEVSNFPSTFRTEDLSAAFKALTRSSFDIKWVDDTHALIVFPDANMALDALQMEHPMFKVCSMTQASSASKKKVKSSSEFLQPYKTRPQTSSLTANRRICAALGLKNPMSSAKTTSERQKIETARQQKLRDKEEQKIVWDGGILPATPTT